MLLTHKNAHNDLSAKYVRSILHYDPETGSFTWKIRKDNPQWSSRYAGKTAGTLNENGRRTISINETLYLASRLAWVWMLGRWPIEEVDHEDRDPSNNRWDNLRPASSSQNGINRKLLSNNTSGVSGVSFHRRIGRWQVRVGKDMKRVHIGYFDTKEEAVKARVRAAFKLHGEFSP